MRSARLGALVVAALVVLVSVPAVTAAMAPVAAQELESAQESRPAAEAHGGEAGAEGQEHAGEGEEHGEAEHHGPTWTDYLFRWINFVLLGALLWWLLVVPPAFVVENFEFAGLKVVLRERAEGILAARNLAREQRQEAETRLTDSRERLDKVEQEADALVEDARADAERERRRLEQEGVEQAAKIRAATDRDLRSEVLRTRRELRVYAADLAVALAADLVRAHLTEEDQRRLVDEYLEDLGRRVA